MRFVAEQAARQTHTGRSGPRKASAERPRGAVAPARPGGRHASMPQCTCGGGCPACRDADGLGRAEAEARGEPRGQPLPRPAREAVAGPGRPLDAATRRLFEMRHGRDLGAVRVHTDAPAAASAAAVGARAYAAGNDVVFGRGAFDPGSPAGRNLIAHELAHVAELSHGPAALQRDPDEAAPVAASDMLGLPAGSSVVITRSMADAMFRLLSAQAPAVGGALGAVSDQRATVVTAEPSRVELRFDQPATLPAAEGDPERTIRDLTLRLSRDDAGRFTFVISGREGDAQLTLYEQAGLTAEADGGSFVLSHGGTPHLRLTPAGSPTGRAEIEAYTAPYLAGQPAWVRSMAPERVGLISAQGLPAAPRGSAEAEAAARRAIARAAADRRSPRSTLMLGAGIAGGIGGPGPNFLTSATYRYAFTPTELGTLLQVPLQLDLMYAPDLSVIGAISSGVGTSLSSLDVPVNVRLTAGLGAGEIEGAPGPSPAAPRGAAEPVFGPVAGLGVGAEAGWFRIEIRGDLLFNVLPGPAPTVVPSASLMLGGAF